MGASRVKRSCTIDQGGRSGTPGREARAARGRRVLDGYGRLKAMYATIQAAISAAISGR